MKTLKNPSGVYVVRIQTEHGRRTISTGSRNLVVARQMIQKAKVKELEQTARTVRLTRDVVAQIVSGRKVRVGEALDAWESWMAESKTKRTALNNLMTVRAWAREMKVEVTMVSAITEKEISRWINDPKDETKLTWRNVKLSCLRRFFDFCSIRNYCLGDPAKLVRLDLQKMSHEQKERREAKVYSDLEIERLVNYARGRALAEERKAGEAEKVLEELPNRKLRRADEAGQRRKWQGIMDKAQAWQRHWQWWEFAVVFGRGTGLRLGDICQLEWDCFKSDKVVVWTDKRDCRVELTMSQPMQNVKLQIKNVGGKYLFPERREQALDGKRRSGLSVEFSRFSQRAGVEGHIFHELRATFLSDFVKKGNSIEAAAKAAGHAHASTTKGYVKD